MVIGHPTADMDIRRVTAIPHLSSVFMAGITVVGAAEGHIAALDMAEAMKTAGAVATEGTVGLAAATQEVMAAAVATKAAAVAVIVVVADPVEGAAVLEAVTAEVDIPIDSRLFHYRKTAKASSVNRSAYVWPRRTRTDK
jgi:hypothetical protein